MGKKLNTEKYIEKAKAIWGDRYDYSKTIYIGSNNKIEIICKEHGAFNIRSSCHLIGRGCYLCGFTFRSNKNTKSFENVISDFIKIHGNRYDYCKSIYKGAAHKIEIICKEHGSFWQAAKSHVAGKGCEKCMKFKTDTEYYLLQSSIIHGNRYDYSLVEYKHSSIEVEIICKEHGSFFQLPYVHLTGSGCHCCNIAISIEETRWLDSLKIPIIRQYKIKPKLIVDGYCEKTHTAYQYHGIYWHGHPDYFDSRKKHPVLNSTYGELYQRTLEKDQVIRDLGFNLITKWSCEDKKINNKKKLYQDIEIIYPDGPEINFSLIDPVDGNIITGRNVLALMLSYGIGIGILRVILGRKKTYKGWRLSS